MHPMAKPKKPATPLREAPLETILDELERRSDSYLHISLRDRGRGRWSLEGRGKGNALGLMESLIFPSRLGDEEPDGDTEPDD